MTYFLSGRAVLKWLEMPSVYHIGKDELYELDDEGFSFLRKCASPSGCSSGRNEFIDYCLDEGVITIEPVSVNRPPLMRSSFPSLRYLELQITGKCNLKCRHCYIGGKGETELSLARTRKILAEFEEMQGLRVLITGGEPLLHSRFSEVNALLPEFQVRKVLFTNGTMLDEKTLRGLNVDEIQISIDGLDHAHDLLRGKGTFKAAIEAVRRARNSGFEVSVSTMVHPANFRDFEGMKELFEELGVKDWNVDVPCITGALKENVLFQTGPEHGGRFLAYGSGGGLHGSAPGFGCGLHMMSVTSSGLAAKCTFYADMPLGSIDDGLRECRLKMEPVRLGDLECDCAHIESCRGGCRFRAELLGDPLGKDLYRCSLLLS
jgi:radical SAM protein with 4Fe4S-binding SPASM domain